MGSSVSRHVRGGGALQKYTVQRNWVNRTRLVEDASDADAPYLHREHAGVFRIGTDCPVASGLGGYTTVLDDEDRLADHALCGWTRHRGWQQLEAM